MRVLIYADDFLFQYIFLIEDFIFRTVIKHISNGFYDVIAKVVTVSGFAHSGVLDLKLPELLLFQTIPQYFAS